jgi:hypothetical protein
MPFINQSKVAACELSPIRLATSTPASLFRLLLDNKFNGNPAVSINFSFFRTLLNSNFNDNPSYSQHHL